MGKDSVGTLEDTLIDTIGNLQSKLALSGNPLSEVSNCNTKV